MIPKNQKRNIAVTLVITMLVALFPAMNFAQNNVLADEITVEPSAAPTTAVTVAPTAEVTVEPSTAPTTAATAVPTAEVTVEPSAVPTAAVTVAPTAEVTVAPSLQPTGAPDLTLKERIDALAQTLDVGEPDEAYTGDINFYITFGSLPTLYALLAAYTDVDQAAQAGTEPAKGYMWYQRGATADPETLPGNITMMEEVNANQYYDASYTEKFMAYALKLYQTYPNAHFNLYCDDLRAQLEIMLFTYNQIPEEQYNVHFVSDGTGSYSTIKSYLGEWNKYAGWYETLKGEAAQGTLRAGFFDGTLMSYGYVACSAAREENVDYWLQFPELITIEGQYADYFEQLNKIKKLPNTMYAELSADQKDDFMNAVLKATGLTKQEYDQNFFPGYEEGTKYMIISGTSPNGEGSSERFETAVNNIIEYYGDSYTYLYKPHPSWPAEKVDGRAEYLQSKGITELPAQTPMECLLWAYPNVEVGGYSSSLYMSATQGQVQFFIAAGPSSLGAPLPLIYELGFYDDAVFFTPEPYQPKASIAYDNGTVQIEGNYNDSVLVAAVYQEDELVKIKAFDVAATQDGNQAVDTAEAGLGDGVTVKFMLWNNFDQMMPKAEPIAVEIPAIAVPTTQPTAVPTAQPTVEPTTQPTVVPTTEPTTQPTVVPTTEPTTQPTVAPTTVPTTQPTVMPTVVPTTQPTAVPTTVPTTVPTEVPAA